MTTMGKPILWVLASSILILLTDHWAITWTLTEAFTIPRPLPQLLLTQHKNNNHQQQHHRQGIFILEMIDTNIANMIDAEYYRQHHKEEYNQQWMERNQSLIKTTSIHTSNMDTTTTTTSTTSTTNTDTDTYRVDNDTDESFLLNRRQYIRDMKLAQSNPQQYCMDRCIATGYCEVYEDLYVSLFLL